MKAQRLIFGAVACGLTLSTVVAQRAGPPLTQYPLQAREKVDCRTVVTQAGIDMELARDQAAYRHLLGEQELGSRALVTYAIQLHIVRRDDGTGGIDVADVRDEISNWVNPYFAAVDIAFVECNPEQYINSTTWFTLGDGSEDPDVAGDAMAAANNVSNLVNVYFVDDPDGACGWSRFPWDLPADYVVIANGCATNQSTLVHELGHYFSLYHTHETAFGAENVTRSGSSSCYNCLTAGDKLCDTPADPNLGSDDVTITAAPGCSYSSALMDGCSTPVAYSPDPTLIMSYSLRACRTVFTTDQMTKMILTKNSAPGAPLYGRNYLQQGCPCTPANAICKNITVNLDASGNASITPADVDNGSTAECGLATISATPSSFTCSDVGSNAVTLTVTDILGWESTCSATVTVADVSSPVLVTAASDMTVECDGAGNTSDFANWLGDAGGATVSDACGGTWSSNSTGLSDGCGSTGSEEVTFTYTDPSGNMVSTTATFSIEDSADPDLTCPADIHLPECVPTASWPELATDVCGTVTVASSPPSGSVFPKGTTTSVTVTATDACGNVTSCMFTVTRDPDLEVAIDPLATSSLNTCAAGTGAHIVLGYGGGPSCVSLHAVGAGGHAPYTYAWSAPAVIPAESFTMGTTASPEFCADFQTEPCVTYTFAVTITDVHGCTETAQVEVRVVNVACYAGSKPKVAVCHRPPGNPANEHTLCISPNAVPAHLGHHPDCLGGCDDVCVPATAKAPIMAGGVKTVRSVEDRLALIAMPNPFTSSTQIVISAATTTNARLNITDLSGREVVELYAGSLQKDVPLQFELSSMDLRMGTYIAKLVDAEGRMKQVKLVLIK